MRFVALAVCLVACQHADSHGPDTPADVTAATTSTEPPPAPALHGGRVVMTAVNEAGDAALTADDLAELRLWPTLDGSHPAVPIAVEAPATRIAIASGDDQDLIVALADAANDVTLVRVGRDGGVRSRAQITSDVGLEQLVFLGHDLLVRRADQTIERYTARGESHGRVVADGGERLGVIAVRDRFAIVASGDGEQPTKRIRRLTVEDQLVWGADIRLPEAILLEPLAISADGQRIAAAKLDKDLVPPQVHPEMPDASVTRQVMMNPAAKAIEVHVTELVLFQLGIGAHAIELPQPVRLEQHARLGFVDNGHLAIVGDNLSWWSAKPETRDPWASEPAQPIAGTQGGSVFGTGVVVTAFAGGLALRDPDHTRYLGWSHLIYGTAQAVGNHVAIGPADNGFVWLDANGDETDSLELSSLAKLPDRTIYGGFVVGDHHIVAMRRDPDHMRAVLVDARDLTTQVDLEPGFTNPQLEVYEPTLHEIAFIDSGTLYRYRISLTPLAAEALTPIHIENTNVALHLVDPERADGAVAMLLGYDDSGYVMSTLYGDGRKQPKPTHVEVPVLAVDANGTWYSQPGGIGNPLLATRDGKLVLRLACEKQAMAVMPSADGNSLVVLYPDAVELFDAHGASRWKRTVWQPTSASLSADNRHLFVPTRGGLLVLDGATGEVTSRACGTRFGLHDLPLTSTVYETPPVCED
jgi:hypothetical protein